MKTNQEMIRPMGNFNVIQRTKDGMFNATDLLKQWNSFNSQQKQIVHYTENSSTSEFINALILEENLKERNSVIIQCRGKNGGTWMHPLLFIDFAMWLNPTFKVKVLKFVSDEMIRYRNDAGDAYLKLSSAVMKIVPRDFMPKAMKKIAEALNWVIFNEHESGIRNKHGEESKQRELFHLESKVTDLINEGFIWSYDQLLKYLRKQWNNNWQPKVLQA